MGVTRKQHLFGPFSCTFFKDQVKIQYGQVQSKDLQYVFNIYLHCERIGFGMLTWIFVLIISCYIFHINVLYSTKKVEVLCAARVAAV